jgi:hypothetical protein
MFQSEKLRGGVVVPTEEGVHGVVQLLTFHGKEQLDLVYYSHPYDIEAEEDYDFLIVLNVEHFKDVVKFYDIKRADLPLIVHIDTPQALATFDPRRAFPGVPVLPVHRASLANDAPDVTLELNLVGKIAMRLNR